MGVTPYRGSPKKPDAKEHYYNTTRYKGFENFVRSEAKRQGVIIEEIERVTGVWEGSTEPATSMWLAGTDIGIVSLADIVGDRYNQDSILLFEPDDNASDFIYRLDIPASIHRDRILEALDLFGIVGARLGTSNQLETVDPDGTTVTQVIALAQFLHASISYSRGRVVFRKKGRDYGK